MTAPEPTVDLTHLDFTPSCYGCGNAAQFILMTRCCFEAYLACEKCRDNDRRQIALVARTIRCKDCKKKITGWLDYIYEQRLA